MDQNTVESYELFVRQILDQIKNKSTINTIKLERDIELQGKDATHRIDIYWKFRVGDIIYSVVIEAKGWSNVVDQEKLFQFKSVLNDLHGQPRGVFVTRTGYREETGAYAGKNNILLYELSDPKEKVSDDRIKTFNLDMSIYTPHFADIRFIQDEEWNKQELKRSNIPLAEASKIRVEVSDDLKFYDENGLEITKAIVLFNSLVPKGFQELPPKRITHTFDKPTVVKTSDTRVRMKITAIEVTISKTFIRFQSKGEDFVDYLLKNVSERTVHTITRRG